MMIFFWEILSNLDRYSDDISENCVVKFATMIRRKPIGVKQPLFAKLVRQLTAESLHTIPFLRLFQ